MAEPLLVGALGLTLAGVALVLLVAIRRVSLGRATARRRGAERRLRPLAFALIEGEAPSLEPLSKRDAEVLASLVARYARSLRGTALAHLTRFFERAGHVQQQVDALRRERRVWRRAVAAHALGEMASQEALPALLDALEDPEREVRAAAARALGQLAAERAVEPLVDALAHLRVPRAVAGNALLAIGDEAVPELVRLASAPDAAVRESAVELVGLLGSPSDGALLLERLRDSSAEVRAKTARGLGRLGAAEAAAELRAALGDRIAFVRTAAAEALGKLRDAEAAAPLLRQAREDGFYPARAAAQALARIAPRMLVDEARDPAAGPHLLEAADLIGASS